MELRLPVPSIPPLWREGLIGLEAASLMRSAVWRGAGQAPGDGRGVVLIPGFLAGDSSLGIMTRWLRGLGYHTHKAGIRAHVDCSTAVCAALEPCLERMAEKTGERVAIVGQSRGGIIARALAVQRPDLVSGIVTLGSPVTSMLRVHPVVLGSIGVVGALGSAKVPHLFTYRCLFGDCCDSFRTSLECQDWPDDVGYTAVYSKHDGIVQWRACLDPCADERIEVSSSHCGMAVHPDVYTVVGRALATFGHADDIPVWTDWAQAA
jgi:pimeloyl-ACP methyl ester carboxylesterase